MTLHSPTNFDLGGSLDPQLYAFEVRQLAKAIRRANSDLGPGKIGWDEVQITNLTKNRSLEAHLYDHGIHEPYGQGEVRQDPKGRLHTLDPQANVLGVDKVMDGRDVPVGMWSTLTTAGRGHARSRSRIPAPLWVFWPWIAAGSAGRIAVTWYRTTKLRDTDCQKVTVSIGDAHVFRAASRKRHIVHAAASRGPIHKNSTVCQGGTTCVATGQDRRLGDFFTNALDPRGCDLIASGDTTKPSPLGGPRPTALPILIRQNSGRRLVGRGHC